MRGQQPLGGLSPFKGNVKINHHGKFDGKLKDGHGDSVTIKGAFKQHAVSGSFVVDTPSFALGGPTTCNSGKVTFGARGSGSPVKNGKYSGVVGAGYPVKFRVSTDGKAVDGLVVKFENTCAGVTSSKPPTFSFKTLTIKSAMVSGTVVDHSGPTVSETMHLSMTFFGRFAMGRLSDTLSITSLPSCTATQFFTATAK